MHYTLSGFIDETCDAEMLMLLFVLGFPHETLERPS